MKKIIICLWFLFCTCTANAVEFTDADSSCFNPWKITYSDDNLTCNSDNSITLTAGSGAPTDADYLVGTANASLSAEIVVGTSPGGELGGTWASPTIDDSLSVSSWTLTTPLISGIFDMDAGSVSDDDCTGQIGVMWFDDTDNAFEFCNADSGVPSTLGGGSGAFDDSADPVVLNTTTKDVAIGAALINSAKLSVDGDADQVQFAIAGHSTQTSNLIEIENSGGTNQLLLDVQGTMTLTGKLVAGGTDQSTFTEGVIVNDGSGADEDDDFIVETDNEANFLEVDAGSETLRVGDGSTDYVQITTGGTISFAGTGGIDLPQGTSAIDVGEGTIFWETDSDTLAVGTSTGTLMINGMQKIETIIDTTDAQTTTAVTLEANNFYQIFFHGVKDSTVGNDVVYVRFNSDESGTNYEFMNWSQEANAAGVGTAESTATDDPYVGSMSASTPAFIHLFVSTMEDGTREGFIIGTHIGHGNANPQQRVATIVYDGGSVTSLEFDLSGGNFDYYWIVVYEVML